MSKKWLYGRNVVLTGCSTGIGKEILLLLVKKYGCNVMGVARNKTKLDELKAELGDKFSYRRFNISSREDWHNFAVEMEEIGFHCDILINNAGMIQPFGSYVNLGYDELDKLIQTNLMSVIYGCKEMLPAIMKSNYGGIVNTASASAILPFGGESIYSATKGGVKGFTESLYQELRGYGIYVGCVMPGPVKTDIYKSRETGDVKADKLVESIGITAKTAGKRIVKAMARRKHRVITDLPAHLMNFGTKVCPVTVNRIVSYAMKKCVNLVSSFRPIYDDQIARAEEIKQRRKEAKKNVYKNLESVPADKVINDTKFEN